VPTYYITGTTASGFFVASETPIAAGSLSTALGWRMTTNAARFVAGDSAELQAIGPLVLPTDGAVSLESSNPKPLVPNSAKGNGLRSPTLLTGTFAAGNWNLGVAVEAGESGWPGRHRFRMRLWRSANADGTSPTELTTSGTVVTDTSTANMALAAIDARNAVVSLPSLVFNNEYLFMTLAVECTTAATANAGRDLEPAGGTGFHITTPTLVTGAPAGPEASMIGWLGD
jgi:hypothetical protein